MKLFLPVLAVAVLTAAIARSQSPVSDFGVRHYTSENGLPQSTVKGIAPDEYGFIWLATESGLLRFDGTGFKLYNKNSTGIVTSRLADMWRTPGGKLIVRNGADELLLISGGTARKYPYSVAEVMYTGTAKGLRRYPLWGPTSIGSSYFLYPFNEHLSAVVSLNKGISWYAEGKPVQHTAIPPLKKFSEIFAIGNALYRVPPRLAGDTLQRLTPEGVGRVRLTGDFLRCPGKDQAEHFFIETNVVTRQTFLYAGQYLYSVAVRPDGDLETKLLLSGFDLKKNWIFCAYHDRVHDRIFLGSVTEGLFIFDRKRFYTAFYPGSVQSVNNFYDHIPFSDSSVLTTNGPIFFSNPAQDPGYRNLRERGHVYFINRLHDGSIAVCYPEEVCRLNSSATAVTGSWPCPTPRSLAEGADGRLWVGADSGLYVIDPRIKQAKPVRMVTTPERIMGMEWEGADTLWVCAVNHLLRISTGSGKVDTVHGLTDKMARALYIPRPGEVWICTYEDGLYLWQKGRLTRFPAQNYPFLNTVHKILEDDRGYFWISTNHGLYQVLRADLLRYAEEGGEEPYCYYYSKESGFQTNEFNGGSQNVGARLANGFFTLASLNGIVFFRPSGLDPELPVAPVLVDKVEVDGREVMFDETIRLERSFRTLSITPVSAYMGTPGNLKYEFRLNDGGEWQSMKNGNVVFSSLPSGYSRISIRKRAGFGAGNYRSCRVVVYVTPAWWETHLFYVLIVTGMALLVGLVIRLRVRYWKRRNKALARAVESRTRDLQNIIRDLEHSERRLGEQLQFQRMLNGNIAHDISTPLRYFTIFTQGLLTQARQEKMPVLSDIEHVHEVTNQIYEVVESLNQYMQSRLSNNISRTRFRLRDVIRKKTELFDLAAEKRNNRFENNVSPALLINQNESLISIVLHNLIDNAVKNTENGTITFDAEEGLQGAVLFRITDTGRGMPHTAVEASNDYFSLQQPVVGRQQRGFGFLIIKEISLLLKLEIRVESTPDAGSSFRVQIPDGNAAMEQV